MLRFVKRLLGVRETPEPRHSNVRSKPRDLWMSTSSRGSTEGYFVTLGQLQQAISKRDYGNAARLARENMRELPELVRSTKREYGSFDIPSVPALQQGGTMLALAGDAEGLKEMREIVSSIPELEPWISSVHQHEEDMRLFAAILQAVTEKPGCLQSDMKNLIGVKDGRRVANLISWLEKAGRISRKREGRSYSLVIAGMRNTRCT